MESRSTNRISPEARLLSLLEVAWTATVSYGVRPWVKLQEIILDLYDQVEEALKQGCIFPQERRMELARAVLEVELLIFSRCAPAPLELARQLVGEVGIRTIVDDFNQRNPGSEFILFHCRSFAPSPYTDILHLTTPGEKEKLERLIAREEDLFVRYLHTLAILRTLRRMLCGWTIEDDDLN